MRLARGVWDRDKGRDRKRDVREASAPLFPCQEPLLVDISTARARENLVAFLVVLVLQLPVDEPVLVSTSPRGGCHKANL